jgi:hypothetical protein
MSAIKLKPTTKRQINKIFFIPPKEWTEGEVLFYRIFSKTVFYTQFFPLDSDNFTLKMMLRNANRVRRSIRKREIQRGIRPISHEEAKKYIENILEDLHVYENQQEGIKAAGQLILSTNEDIQKFLPPETQLTQEHMYLMGLMRLQLLVEKMLTKRGWLSPSELKRRSKELGDGAKAKNEWRKQRNKEFISTPKNYLAKYFDMLMFNGMNDTPEQFRERMKHQAERDEEIRKQNERNRSESGMIHIDSQECLNKYLDWMLFRGIKDTPEAYKERWRRIMNGEPPVEKKRNLRRGKKYIGRETRMTLEEYVNKLLGRKYRPPDTS